MQRKLELGRRIQSQAVSLSSCPRCNWHPISTTTDSSRVSDFSAGLSKHQREGKTRLVNPAWLLWTAASGTACFAHLVQRALSRMGTAKRDSNLRSKSDNCQQRGSTLRQRSFPWLSLSLVQHPKSTSCLGNCSGGI